VSKRNPARLSKRHSVYTITGPSGVYVGCSANIEKRWIAHRAMARGGGRRGPAYLRIHDVMCRDGVERYTFAVVAESPDMFAGVDTERAIALQLRREGATLLCWLAGEPRPRWNRRQRPSQLNQPQPSAA
jgi:hypothetical protein